MHIQSHDDDSPGPWVQLERESAKVSVGRWSGPVGPGTTITTTDAGHYAFAALDLSDGSPLAIFRWVPDTP